MTTLPWLLLSAMTAAAPETVLLDFSATWCQPCQQMNPIIARLERQGYPIRRVDVDRESELTRAYNISAIPAFVLVVNGREVQRISGATTEQQLRGLLAKLPQQTAPQQAPPQQPQRQAPRLPNTPMFASGPSRKTFADEEAPTAIHTQPPPAVAPRFSIPFLSRNDAVDQPRQETPRQGAVVRAKLDDEPLGEPLRYTGPLSASTRIRVNEAGRVSFGSGTIIDSRIGRTIVLTCGHVLRGLKPDDVIEVDLFINNRKQTFVGKSVGVDLEGDVGLIEIPTDQPLPTAPLAALDQLPNVKAPVQSVGCGGGENPSLEDHEVTAINRYRGPANIECSGMPMQGRSGGGLFDANGRVIGVCSAADPQDRRGLYAGLQPIHQLLKKHDLERLVPEAVAPPAAPASNFPDETIVVSSETDAPRFADTADLGAAATRATTSAAAAPTTVRPAVVSAVAADRMQEADSLEEALAEHEDEDVEVVFVIRPRRDPNAPSRVVVLNRASPQFIDYLTAEARLQGQPVLTTLEVPPPPSKAAGRRISSRSSSISKVLADAGNTEKLRDEEIRHAKPVRSPATSGQMSRNDANPVTALTRPRPAKSSRSTQPYRRNR